MKKALIWTGVGLVALLIAALVVSVLCLGKIVKNRAEAIGPEMTKGPVTLDAADIWLFPGHAELKGLVIGNPPNYKTKVAVQVGDMSVRLNPFTAFSEKMVIDSINIKSPEITIEGGLKNNNLTQIEKNVDDYLNSGGAPPSPSQPPTLTNAPAPTKKYQINDLAISGAKLHIVSFIEGRGNISLSIPDIHLTKLGEGEGGITAPEVAKRVLAALEQSVSEHAGDAISNIGKEAISGAKNLDLKKAGQKLKGIFGQ